MEELRENQKLTATGNLPVESNKSLEISSLKATKYFSQLSIEQKEIFDSIIGKVRIKEIDPDEFVLKMDKLIKFVHSCCGQEIDVDNHELSIFALCSDLQKYWGTYTFEEITLYFNNGYKKVYGEYYGLNNKTYFDWLKAATTENRAKAVKAIQDSKQYIENPPPPPPTPEQIEAIHKESAINAWKTVQNRKELFDINNLIYDYLDGLKLIIFTPAEKKEMLEIVKTKMIEDQKAKLVSPDLLQAKNIKDLIEDYRFGVESDEKNEDGSRKLKTHPLVVTATKRYALTAFFKQLIDKKVDFEELLNKAIETSKNA